MFKRTCVIGFILVVAVYLIKCIFVLLSGVQLAEFNPAGVIFLVDTSASNRKLLSRQEETVLQICKRLDSEDRSWIYVVTEDTFRIYDQNPHKLNAIRKAFESHAKFDSKSYGTAYGLALKKAVDDALLFKSEGYRPSIVILGDLENEGDIKKQINWNKLPRNIERTMRYIPDLTIAFLYAHPRKLDSAREKLKTVMPDKQLFFASEENVDLTVKTYMQALGR